MLKVEHLTKMFGGLAAVNDVSVEFETGKINAIIGRRLADAARISG